MTGPGPAPDQDIEERWRFPLGRNQAPAPAVVDGAVFAGNEAGILYAINAATGAEIWSFATGGTIYSTATVSDGVVYLGAGTIFFAIDALTGEEKWRAQVKRTIVRSSALVVDGLVYFSASDLRYRDDRYSHFYGLDIQTGQILREYELNVNTVGDYNFTPASSPALTDRLILVSSMEGPIIAIDRPSGKIIWKSQTWSDTATTPLGEFTWDNSAASPTVVGSRIYYRTGNLFYILDTATGGVLDDLDLKSVPVTTSGHVTVAFANGYVYLPVFLGVIARNIRNIRQESWGYFLEAPASELTTTGFFASPAVAEGVVYVGNDDGLLVALDADDGDLLWTHDVSGKILSSPAVAGDAVYVTTTAGYVIALANEGSVPTDSEPGGSSLDHPVEPCVTPTPNNDPPPGATVAPDPCQTATADDPGNPSAPGDDPLFGPDDICVTPTPNSALPPGESEPPRPCPTQAPG